MKVSFSRRSAALLILENLARSLQGFTADFFFIALEEAGFSAQERKRLMGGCFKTAQNKRWIQQTGLSLKSKRNSSNLQNIWLSNIFGFAPDGSDLKRSFIESEHTKWKSLGMEIPAQEAKFSSYSSGENNRDPSPHSQRAS